MKLVNTGVCQYVQYKDLFLCSLRSWRYNFVWPLVTAPPQTTSSPPFFLRDSRASETRARVKITPREKRRHAAGREKNESPRRVSPFLAWDNFHARSRFSRSTIPEEKWGATRSLAPPSNLTRLHYDGSATKSHSTTTQYRQLRRLVSMEPSLTETMTSRNGMLLGEANK